MSLRNFSIAAGLLAASLGLASPAVAADGFALRPGPLRAGPASDYPTVGRVGPGEPLTVFGCLARYSWCDVFASGERGWFPGRRIGFERGGRRVPLPAVAGVVGLSIVGFALNDYWRSHYRGRPWYEDRRWRRGPRDHRPPFGMGPRPRTEMPRGGPGMRPPRDRTDPDEMRPPRDRRGPGDMRPPRESQPPRAVRPPTGRPDATGPRTDPRTDPRTGPREQPRRIDPTPTPRSGSMPGGPRVPDGGGRPGGAFAPQPCGDNCR